MRWRGATSAGRRTSGPGCVAHTCGPRAGRECEQGADKYIDSSAQLWRRDKGPSGVKKRPGDEMYQLRGRGARERRRKLEVHGGNIDKQIEHVEGQYRSQAQSCKWKSLRTSPTPEPNSKEKDTPSHSGTQDLQLNEPSAFGAAALGELFQELHQNISVFLSKVYKLI